ncbi:hypothetical protein PF010_g11103 [Phytophthora fragariae]|uniref:PAS domain-containing protein n=1 Tax=Phytophthora fragariae TaxID=53985 RepID=A0A6A3KGW6_9STRA|nr:hypothetical protein PF011_g11498 [Phytophthora fragariae]KAE9110610.1 hypothetical protein PF010_g11103 [Phytophthora fragariae]KAE9226397.1 hypothetical protein PF004_g11659 [Phytophthora fragariae]
MAPSKGKRGRRRRYSARHQTPVKTQTQTPRLDELFRMLHDGRVALPNPRMEEITGFEAARVIGRPLADFRPELELHIPLRNTKGHNVQVLTNMTLLLAEDGACVGVYGVDQDVPEWTIH